MGYYEETSLEDQIELEHEDELNHMNYEGKTDDYTFKYEDMKTKGKAGGKIDSDGTAISGRFTAFKRFAAN